MKKHILILALMCLFVVLLPAERKNYVYTLTAGSPVRLATQKMLASRLFIQNAPMSGGGVTIVMLGVPAATTCDSSQSTQVTAYLAPATATAPGGSFSDPQGAPGNTIPDSENMALACLDTTITGTKVVVSFWRQN